MPFEPVICERWEYSTLRSIQGLSFFTSTAGQHLTGVKSIMIITKTLINKSF